MNYDTPPPAVPDLRGTGRLWRKAWPYLMLVVFALALGFGQPLLHRATDAANGVTPEKTRAVALLDSLRGAGDSAGVALVQRYDPELGNAPQEMVAADQQAGGYLQLGAVLSKLFCFVLYFVVFALVSWAVQARTHPAPTAWAKENYKVEFGALPSRERFHVYQNIRLHYAIIGAAALLAAALTQ